MRTRASGFAHVLTWLTVAIVFLLLLGTCRYGWSMRTFRRIGIDMVDRLDGPMTFRLRWLARQRSRA
jgi:hypothetical protein